MTDPFARVRLSAIPPLKVSVPPVRLMRPSPARPESQPERRRSVRQPVREEVLVRALQADGAAAGPAFRAIVTEISHGGLRLFCDRPMPPGSSAIRFGSAHDAQVRFAELARIRKVPGGYEYAGAFTPVAQPVTAG